MHILCLIMVILYVRVYVINKTQKDDAIMAMTINIKMVKKCAFCKNWYNPTNQGITPKAPDIGLWAIEDPRQKCLCCKTKLQMPASHCCKQYECKF